MTTNNAFNSQNPVQVAKGGTGIATTTPYSLITGGAGSTDPLQMVGTGTSGQLLQSNGNAALPTWVAGSSGGQVLIGTFTASSQATLDITGITGYYRYSITLERIVPATNSSILYLRTSTNNGSSFDSGAGNYAWAFACDITTGTSQNSSDTSIHLVKTVVTNDANLSGVNGVINMVNPSAAKYNVLFGQMATYNAISNFQGTRLTTADVDAIQLLFDSGNITSGVVKVYGIIT